MLYWFSLDISQFFQHLLVTPIVLMIPKVPFSFPMDLGEPLILIFKKVLEVVGITIITLNAISSMVNLVAVPSPIWELHQ